MKAAEAAALLRHLFHRAVAAAQPGGHLVDYLPPPQRARTIVVGAGKAAAGMAEALETARRGDVTGCVAVPDGTRCDCRVIECLTSGGGSALLCDPNDRELLDLEKL